MRSRPTRAGILAAAATTAAAALVPLTAGTVEAASPTELLLSEYVEGSSNNKALEVYNGTGATVDLSGYDVQMFFNGSASAGTTVALSGTVADGDVFVLAHASAVPEILAEADQTSSASFFNGDDAIVLRKDGVVVDSLGQVGVDPGTEWGSGLTSTADNTLRRKESVTAGDTDPSDAFDPAVEWDGFETNTFDGLGSHLGDGTEEPPPGDGPAPECDADFTPIPEIQGSGDTAAVTGPVATEGVVVGDHEGPQPMLRGFYLQDPEGDGDPATSDAIFVFNGSDDDVELGDRVRVVGSAGEFQGQTQISDTTSLEVCDSGVTVEPTELQLPATEAEREALEGMLVTVPQTLTVTEHFQLGRFGQVVVSSGGRLLQPTDVAAPGDEAAQVQAANDRRRLIIDDSTQAQNPDPIVWGRGGEPLSADNTLRGGDTVTDAVGVLTYTWGGNAASPNDYRLRPVGALGGQALFEATNPRPDGPPEVGGSLQVAGMNVLNYFDTFTGCTGGVTGAPMDCRGAEDGEELERQAVKTVEAITRMGAEVVGVVEIENDGYGDDSALADLVDRLNAVEGEGTWDYVDVDAETGQPDALGTDAIKVGAIYQPDAVSLVGTAALNTESFRTGGDADERNRPALAASFRENASGEVFTAVVNHLKSKGSACAAPDAGDGQGNCNQVRVNAATELAEWLAGDPTGVGDEDVLILGDLNAYAQEDPVTVLKDAGYTDLVGDRQGEEAYSYVFDGQWGSLDHALGSASIDPQVTGAAPWHVNADEPSVLDYNTNFKTPAQVESLFAPDEFRNSDHDPVLVGLDLAGETTGTDGAVLGGGLITSPSLGLFGLGVHAEDGRVRGVVTFASRQATLISTSLDGFSASDGTARITGTATVGGRAGHTFEVTAVDGGPRGRDEFRIVVRKPSGEQVLDTGSRRVMGQVIVQE